MLDEFVLPAVVFQTGKTDLRYDGPELATRRRYTVCCGPVTGGEDLSRDNECRSVRAKVLEEVGQAVEEDEPLRVGVCLGQSIIAKALTW
jgi:hypothetical protein